MLFDPVSARSLPLFNRLVVVALLQKRADLIALGRPFPATPHLAPRLRTSSPQNARDVATLLMPDAKDYTDYPAQAT